MKKRFLMLGVTCLLLLAGTSCRKGKTADNPTTAADSLAGQTLGLSTPEQRQELQANQTISRANAITRAVAMIEPAVVSVNVIKTTVVRRSPYDDPFFGLFGSPAYRQQVQGIGTGIIYHHSNGRFYVITNAHVVEGATDIQVVLTDGRTLAARLLNYASVQDIAVLELPYKDLPSVKIGSSSDLMPGEWCIALGNPFGLLIKDSKPSVSVGVISAVNRNFSQNNGKLYKKMIQTDAAINPGNSGGPLVNILGELIGINTFILSDSGGSVGVGFAIPVDRVLKFANEIIEHGKVRDIDYGFKVLPTRGGQGVVVARLSPLGPAASAGVQLNDVITQINDTYLSSGDDAELAVSDLVVGDRYNVHVQRSGKEYNLTLTAKPRTVLFN